MSTPAGPSRAGARRGEKPARRLPAGVVARGAAAVATLVAWVALVLAAIHFGRVARGGDGQAWWWLALAAAGAVASLFGSLLLTTAALRRLGILADRSPRRH